MQIYFQDNVVENVTSKKEGILIGLNMFNDSI